MTIILLENLEHRKLAVVSSLTPDDYNCAKEGVSKTDFIRNAIHSWPENNEQSKA